MCRGGGGVERHLHNYLMITKTENLPMMTSRMKLSDARGIVSSTDVNRLEIQIWSIIINHLDNQYCYFFFETLSGHFLMLLVSG